MPYSVKATQNIGTQGYTITALIQLMSGSNPPDSITFPNLGNPVGATTNLGVDQGSTVNWTPNNAVTRSVGLLTCASVCYLNSDNGIGYVYHANTGHITQTSFNTAMTNIGATTPYNKVYIAYTHMNNTDRGYQNSLVELVQWGIPTNNIVEVTNLFLSQFGLNNHLQLGY